MSAVMGGKVEREIGYTLRVGGKASGVHDRRNWDGYIVNGKERRLTPRQGLKIDTNRHGIRRETNLMPKPQKKTGRKKV
jgi:hypothetical protein